MPTNAGKSGSTLSGEFWGGLLDGVSGTLGFPHERRVSLMFVTMQISAMGVKRTLLRRLLGGGRFALASRREVFASLGVSCTATTSSTPSRRCRLNGALHDELLLVIGLAPCLGDKLVSGTLRDAPRYRRISEWRWRLLRVHYTGGLSRLVRSGRGERRACSPRLKRRRTSEQHARCTCSRCTACSEVEVDYFVFLPGEPDQPPQAHYT